MMTERVFITHYEWMSDDVLRYYDDMHETYEHVDVEWPSGIYITYKQ